MSRSRTQISRLAEKHYQVRVSRGFCVLDVRVNGDADVAERTANYLASGLDALLDALMDDHAGKDKRP